MSTLAARRVLFVPALVSAMIAVTVAPASADDLDHLMSAASEAEYAGRQIVVALLDGETRVEVVEVEHSGRLMMVGEPGAESVVGSGKLSGGGGAGLAISSWKPSYMSDRYVIGASSGITRLGRAATSIEVLEDDAVRARFVFDDESGTPLSSDVFKGDGKLFRFSAMIELDLIPDRLYSAQGHYADEFEVMVPTSADSMPEEAAGYVRADAYAGPDDSVQGFFSDGLFSFSLFEVKGSARSERFSSAQLLEMDGRRYRRLLTPSEIWVTWEARGRTYVLVGDLPPDHLEEVLAVLPKPGRRNIISRLWKGLFG